ETPVSIKENRSRSQSFSYDTRPHILPQDNQERSANIQRSQFPGQDIRHQTQHPQNRSLQEFQENIQISERTKWEQNLDFEAFDATNNNVSSSSFRPSRRHTVSSTNSTYKQNSNTATNNAHRQMPMNLIFTPYQPRPPIQPQSLPIDTNQSVAPPGQLMLSPVSNIPSGMANLLTQIPEESTANLNDSLQFINFTHTPSFQSGQTQSKQPSITRVRPSPHKRKSKGALDFILNTSGESNQKRSKFDDENNGEQY
ncbi:4876_t:CDS:1, partial [Acaulospora morrowiae]